jgi:CelD/BcsL family acetyltransferase involved in cellulose biosynthesis
MMSTIVDVHEKWATPGFELDPVAPRTGPFVRRAVLGAWYAHRGAAGTAMLVEGPQALLPLFAAGRSIRFLGEADLTDYHSPLGDPDSVRALTAAFFSTAAAGTEIDLDSLPSEALAPLRLGLRDAGIEARAVRHEVAAVLTLPPTFDDWLAAIGKKERHEVRRKRRRFIDELGGFELRRAAGPDAVATFATMHRAAAGDKGSFMTTEVEALFEELHRSGGGVIDVVTGDDGEPVAAAFGFEDADGYYLYNSAYDPAARHASPGIVLLAALIEQAIESGKPVFDFLKGDETYKFRHGAEPRPLYRLTARVPG